MSHKHSTAALRQNHEIIWERKILQTFFIDFPSSCLFYGCLCKMQMFLFWFFEGKISAAHPKWQFQNFIKNRVVFS